MKIDVPLLKLPRTYCAKTLATEVAALPLSAWLTHPGRLVGNDAVPLISPAGAITNAFKGPMASTEHLRHCPYILEIMADLGAVWGRSRLMGLAPGAVVPKHVDVGHYWRTHLRIHIPVVTSRQVEFTCAGETVNMAAGECWIFDSFRTHDVRNGGTEKRVHLVLDTVGGDELWGLMDLALREGRSAAPQFVSPGCATTSPLRFEQYNTPEIMSVWEARCHVAFLMEQIPEGPGRDAVQSVLDRFLHRWGALWAEFGDHPDGLPDYARVIVDTRDHIQRAGANRIALPNKIALDRALNELIFMAAAPDVPSLLTVKLFE